MFIYGGIKECTGGTKHRINGTQAVKYSLLNPEMAAIVESCNLQNRSKTWFRNLFKSQNWKSPESRKPLRRDGRAAHPLRTPSPQKGQSSRRN